MVLAHVPGWGCDDGHLDEGPCAVSRGMHYATEVARASIVHAVIIEECRWAEHLAERKAQLSRNLRAAGIH